MLKRTRTIALFITIMIALTTLASSCFDFIKPNRGLDAQDIVDDLIDESKDDDETIKLNTPVPESWYQPQVPYIELFDNPRLGSLDWGFNMLYPTAMTDDRAKVVFTVDPNTGKLIYSIKGTEPGLYLPQVDQVGWGYFMLQFDHSWSGPPPDVVFPCDQDINNLPPGQDWFTICPPDAAVSSGNSWHIVYSVFDAPIPWGDMDHSYTYAGVFDADGIPENNFQYMDPYNWDYWQNTDQWYILDWMNHNQTWSAIVLGQNGEPVESNARAVVYDNAVFWIISTDEFAVPQPGGRFSSFATTGGWDPADVGGEVNGDNPTEPLTPLDSDPIHVVDPPFTFASVVLDEDWEICGSGQCIYAENFADEQTSVVFCMNSGCSDLGGECSLFSRAKEDPPQDPTSWSYVAGPEEKIQKDWALDYHCYCVK